MSDKNIKDEKWLGAMKDRLDGYPSEGARPFDWSKLDAVQPDAAGASAGKASGPRRRWIAWTSAAAVAAAACLALVVTLRAPSVKPVAAPSLAEAAAPVEEPAQQEPIDEKVGGVNAAVERSVKSSHPSAPVHRISAPEAEGQQKVALASEESQSPAAEALQEKRSDSRKDSIAENQASETVTRNLEKMDYKKYEDYFAEDEAVPSRKGLRAHTSLALAAGNSLSSSSIQGVRMMSSLDKIERLYSSSLSSADEESDASATYLKSLPNSNATASSVALEGMTYEYAYDIPLVLMLSARYYLENKLFIESGLTYTRLGTTVMNGRSVVTNKQNFHYIGLPLEAGWSFVDTRYFTSYVAAGAMAEKCVYATNNGSRIDVKPMQYAILARAGAQVNIIRQLGLFVEPGFTYYFKDGSEYHTARKESPATFTVTGGLRFTL